MSLAASDYRAPWWLPGGHLQTIVPAELFPKAKVIYRREIWNTPDDDIIAVDWSTPEPIDPKAPIMVHIHGLEGSSNSHYARALMARCGQEGVRGVVIHYRGCGGVTNKKLRAYNAADAEELDWEFARLRELYPEAPIYAMGVSLGANNLLFWAGTRGEDAAKLVSEKGFDEVLLLGGLGGRRVEHTLANLCTGLGLEQRGVRTTLLDERSRITYVMPGETRRYPKEKYFFFSAFPMEGRAQGVCERGSYYELTDAELTASYPLGVSNEYAAGSDCITISTRSGALVVVETIAD